MKERDFLKRLEKHENQQGTIANKKRVEKNPTHIDLFTGKKVILIFRKDTDPKSRDQVIFHSGNLHNWPDSFPYRMTDRFIPIDQYDLFLHCCKCGGVMKCEVHHTPEFHNPITSIIESDFTMKLTCPDCGSVLNLHERS